VRALFLPVQIPSLRIGVAGQYYYYARYKSAGADKLPIVFAALDQPPQGASLLVALEVWANFSGINGAVGAIEMPQEIPNGTYATFLELDATRTYVLQGYGADGVTLTGVTEPSQMSYEAHLRVSNATKQYALGAYQGSALVSSLSLSCAPRPLPCPPLVQRVRARMRPRRTLRGSTWTARRASLRAM